MEKGRVLFYTMILSFVIAIAGCTQDDSKSSDRNNAAAEEQSVEREVKFEANFSALRKGGSSCANCRLEVSDNHDTFSIDDLMTGTLYVENVDDEEGNSIIEGDNLEDADFEFQWSIYLNDDFFAQSNLTIALPVEDLDEGTEYEFYLIIEGDEGQQYVGSARHELGDEEQATVDLTITPVIGDVEITANLAGELGLFKFDYPGLSELDLEDEDLVLEITVDDETVVFEFNGDYFKNEEEDDEFLSMFYVFEDTFTQDPSDPTAHIPNPHTIDLALIIDGIQVARGHFHGDVTPGSDIEIDLTPLHGEVAFNLFAEGDTSNALIINIPAEVVEEAGMDDGNQSELSVEFEMFSADGSGLIEINEEFGADDMTEQLDGDYQISFLLEDLHFDEVEWSLTFDDEGDGETIAWCDQNEETFDLANDSLVELQCDITLRRRAEIYGTVWVAVGINALTLEGAPVGNALVEISDEGGLFFSGQTGDALDDPTGTGFGTEGYLKVMLPAGAVFDIDVTYSGLNPDTGLPMDFAGSDVWPFGINEDGSTLLVHNMIIDMIDVTPQGPPGENFDVLPSSPQPGPNGNLYFLAPPIDPFPTDVEPDIAQVNQDFCNDFAPPENNQNWHIADSRDPIENAFIASLFGPFEGDITGAFLGGVHAGSGNWVWASTATDLISALADPIVGFTNWDGGIIPTVDGLDFLFMSLSGTWIAHEVSPRAIVCEQEVGDIPPPPGPPPGPPSP